MNSVEQRHRDFFRTGSKPDSLALQDAPAINTDGLAAFMVMKQTVPKSLQSELDTQRQYLIDLAGVANAYVRKEANNKKNPDLVFDAGLWLHVYNNLPLMSRCELLPRSFSQILKGSSIATAFSEAIMGHAVTPGPGLAAFSRFLGSLGSQVAGGLAMSLHTSYSVCSTAIVVSTRSAGEGVVVDGYLKLFAVDFNFSNAGLFRSCVSPEAVQVDFKYREASSLFDAGALEDAKTKRDFENFLSRTQVEDIKRSRNFFGRELAEAK